MPVPVGISPDLATYLQELEDRLLLLEEPQSPGPVFACEEADLPDPSLYMNGVLRVTDLNILAASDGSDWIRQDTGAPI